MRNKGAIILLAIAMTLVSIYQLSFTWVTNGVKKDAAEYAKGNLQKETAYIDSIAAIDNYFLWYSYKDCQAQEINLGLDLKGGMNVILEVSVVDLIRSLSNNNKDEVFISALNRAKELQENSQDDFVTLFGQAFNEVAPEGARLAAIFNTIDLKDRITYNSTNEEVIEIVRKETQDAIDNSFNIIRTRIDHFGVTQPNVQRLDVAGRVLVELPGIKDPERVRKLLQGTANLEFWETFDNTEIFESLRAANDKVKEVLAKDESLETKDSTTTEQAVTEETLKDSTVLAVDGETKKDTTLSLLEEIEKDTTKSVSTDNAFAAFEKENPLFAVLRPSERDGQLLKGAAVGTSHIKDTGKVNKYLKLKQVKEILPRNLKLIWEVKPIDYKTKGEYFQLIAIKVTNRDGLPALGGEVITNARDEFGQNQATAEVSMSMNAEGAQKWARITKENIGKQIAIVLDNFVYSYPVVNGEIKGGRSSISGNFTVTEAKDLANILKSGKLPAPARIIEEQIVGPSLGEQAINSGLISFVIAFFVILLYMIFYYKTAGYVADIALITNIFFIFGVLSSFGAVLTLPGMAGIVLTIGMSVDANVLIYERIREELSLGKGIKLAVADGYNNAYSAILDANITTFLTAVILFIFGHGPIKGFAITLMIGILTSLFSAIFITRLVFIWLLDKKKTISFSTKFTENAFKNLNIDFIGKRKLFYGISVIIVILGIVSLATRGLKQGIDFKGGRTYVVKFENDVNTVEIAKNLATPFDGNTPEVKTYGGDNQVKISTIFMVDNDDANSDSIVEAKLYEGLKVLDEKIREEMKVNPSNTKLLPIFDGDVNFEKFISDYRQSSRKVGPTIADDIKIAAIYSIIFSLIIMFVYIFVRFKNWQFGIGAIVALAHDVLITLGIFSILYGIMPFSLEIDQAFIAAILTVIGYSLNDTVVVFDRI